MTNKTLLWVKLELGEVATTLVPRLYKEELSDKKTIFIWKLFLI